MQPEASTLPKGTTLRGRYKIINTINSGGFGNVYLAHDKTFDKNVAVKEAFYNDEETRKQFDFEAQVLIHVNHKDVVRGYEAFEERGRFYLVMQYIEGLNLEELQIKYFKESRHPIPEPIVLQLMSTICSATQALHDGHIIHRDIKPANIKLNHQGDPILLDLGLAKLFRDPESVTLIAARAYTPGYAPPEQCEEEGTTNELTDVYALGATTYYALTGRQPWEAIKRLSELQLGHTDLPPPSAWLPSVSAASDAVVMRALELNPTKRFRDAKTMQVALMASAELLARPTAERQPVICTNCYVPNSIQDTACRNCGAALPQTAANAAASAVAEAPNVAATASTAPNAPVQMPPTQQLEIKSPVTNLPTVVINEPPIAQRTLDMPSLPERVQPRKRVPTSVSSWATATVALGTVTLIPVVGWFFLPFVLFIGIHAMSVIRRSKGSRRGIARTNIGFLLGLLGLAEAVALIWFFILFH